MLDFSDAVADAAAVGFELLLAGSARANAAAEPRKLFAAPGQPRQQIVQLREFHLQLAFARARVGGEDIENQLRAVDDAAAGAFFHVAELHGREIVVDNHERHVTRLRLGSNFLELAAADERCGIERIAHLQHAPGNRRAGALGQFFRAPRANRAPLPVGRRPANANAFWY